MYARGHKPRYTVVQRRISSLMKGLGVDDLSHSQLAKRWDETPQAVGNFLRDPEGVRLETARRFCKHLNCTLNDIYEPRRRSK